MSWIENPGVQTFRGLNISDLSVDQGWLIVTPHRNSPPLWLYSVSGNCHDCPFQRQSDNPIVPNTLQKLRAFKISSQFSSRYRLRTEGNWSIVSDADVDPWSFCQIELDPGEFGVYDLSVNDSQKCSVQTLLDPVNIYLPLLIFFLFYATLIIGTVLIKRYGNAIGRALSWITPSCFDHYLSALEVGVPTPAEAPLLPPGTSMSSSGNVNSSSEDVETRPQSRKKKSKRGARGRMVEDEVPQEVLPEVQDSGTTATTSTSSTIVQASVSSGVEERSAPERFSSLDAFRGLCIVIMIFVDDNAGLYHFFEHCTWDGLYLADVAFPWFLWIMGTCIPISILAQKKKQTPKSTILKKILLRSLKLVLIGIFIINTSSKPNPVPLGKVRIPGVLQRFGVCYFVASVLVLYFIPEGDGPENQGETTPTPSFSSQLKKSLWKNVPWLFVMSCVTLHSCIIFLLPVPGCPTGYLGPGGLHLNNKYPPHCIGGATGYIDRLLFTKNHIYAWPTAKEVYSSGPFDPEGTLGLLTSILQVWLGVQAGLVFVSSSLHQNQTPVIPRLKSILAWSLVCLIIGLILCGGGSGGLTNKGWIPVNKNLWSLSFVLVTSGLAFLVLSILYVIIDVQRVWSGGPFLEAGMNSMLLYMGHEVFSNSLPWNFSFGRMSTHFSHLVESLWGTSLWVGIAVYFYRKKWFLVL